MPPYAIDRKLVVAVSSSALFDLAESDRVFENDGPRAYESYQLAHLDHPLEKGVAFPFIRRFLKINERFLSEMPVEVVLLSRNTATTGRRVSRSIAHHGLDISRAAFMGGGSPYPYIPAFNASLFLSADAADVLGAIDAGYPAGRVLPGPVLDDAEDDELCVAFDFDGVLADDEAEAVYRRTGDLNDFHSHERDKADVPLMPGPLADLFKKLSRMQKLEDRAAASDRSYRRVLRTAIITARNAPADERMITTLQSWGVSANETYFLGGMAKSRVLDVLRPHIFFDDQLSHLEGNECSVPMVHIPFGIANAKVGPQAESSEGDAQ